MTFTLNAGKGHNFPRDECPHRRSRHLDNLGDSKSLITPSRDDDAFPDPRGGTRLELGITEGRCACRSGLEDPRDLIADPDGPSPGWTRSGGWNRPQPRMPEIGRDLGDVRTWPDDARP